MSYLAFEDLSPPGPGSLHDLGGGEGEGRSVEGRKLPGSYLLEVRCISESEAPYGLPGSFLSGVGKSIYFLVS